jgi:hypothetical protein
MNRDTLIRRNIANAQKQVAHNKRMQRGRVGAFVAAAFVVLATAGIAIGESQTSRARLSGQGPNSAAAGWTSNGTTTSTTQGVIVSSSGICWSANCSAKIHYAGAGLNMFAAGADRITIADGNGSIGINGGTAISVSGAPVNYAATAPISSAVASGSNAFATSVNGARWDLGAAAADYLYSDGTNVNIASGLLTAAHISSGTYVQSQTYMNIGSDLYVNPPGGIRRVMFNAAPTISSGFGTSPSIVAGSGTWAFRVNVGTGGTASAGVIGLPTAVTGWNCMCNTITTHSATVHVCKQTADTTASVTIGNFTTAGAAGAWVASNIVAVNCTAY